jgi:hypothetical protein
MPRAQNRHFGCRITDDLVYKGMRTLFLENEVLRVGVLLDKGADIFQFLHKPSDTDFLWRSPSGIVDPQTFTPTVSTGASAFLDSYHGGWQEILPGGGPVTYRGAELGLHGEVTTLRWEADILHDTPEAIEVILRVDCIRTPFRLERHMRLEAGRPALLLHECLTNLSPSDQEFMWGHHPACGAPFLRQGVRLIVPAAEAEVHQPSFAGNGIFAPGQSSPWPRMPAGGRMIDLSEVPGPDAGYADLLCLKGLSAGWYAVLDPVTRLGFGLAWPVEIFPYVWFWQVFGAAPGYPWWDRAYVIALEPWTSIPNHLEQAMVRGVQARLKGGESLEISMAAVALSGRETIRHIDTQGTIA